MTKLTEESAQKLQKILKKRSGHELSQTELEEAYEALMGFAEALLDLGADAGQLNQPIANKKEDVLQYV